MNIPELKAHLVETIEGMAAIDRQLAGLSSSLIAMKLALSEVSPDRFATAYEKHFVGIECETVRQSLLRDADLLLAAATALRQEI